MTDDFLKSSSAEDAQRLRVEALGEPGQRRFRMLVAVQGETHIVWMEKQQLQALGLAVEQILDQVSTDEPELETSDVPVELDEQTGHQFRLGRVELGFEEPVGRIVISAFDLQQDDEAVTPSLNIRLSRAQAKSLSVDAATVAAAGRPRCPMCGAPMDREGHVCPEQNGHLPLSFDEDDTA